MKRFLGFCSLLAFAVLPLTVHASTLPVACATCVVKVPEFDLGTISSGMALLVGAGWLFVRRLRRNR